MSTLSVLTEGIYNKLVGSNYNPDVTFDECKNLLADSVVFPRIEIDMPLAGGSQYISQRNLQWGINYRIFGFLKKEGIADGDSDNDWMLADRVAILDFGMDTVARCFSLMDDKQNGIFVCNNFLYFEAVPNIWTDLEILPKIMTFAFDLVAVVDKTDTEV